MIDRQRIQKSKLYNEFSDEDLTFWFDQKTKKFMHNVDTFYYSVKLAEDFTFQSQDKNVLAFRRAYERLECKLAERVYQREITQLFIPGMNDYLNVVNHRFDKYYRFCLQLPEMFDIFMAPEVPAGSDGSSVTSEIIVQIRSSMLWNYGVHEAFKRSYEWVKGICGMYGFTIMEVKENRTDFCWHSNYLENPDRFFSSENFDDMRCTKLGKKTTYIRYDRGSNGSDFSYLSRGQRGDKTFLRIYNKTMEVVQEGYKDFFLKTWLFHGLINRYDFDVLEAAYKEKSWDYISIARLKFYVEHGTDAALAAECKEQILLHDLSGCYTDKMISLAEKLTPPVTTIINVEFQLMRKASKSYEILPLKDNSSAGPARRIFDFLDNRRLIAEYLTTKVFRLVEKTGDSNKSRRPDCAFWAALRRTKMVDTAAVPEGLTMKRIYHRELSGEAVKKRALRAITSRSIYRKGKNDNNPMDDIVDFICTLNDNDIHDMTVYKQKRVKQFADETLEDVMPGTDTEYGLAFVNKRTGEIFPVFNDYFES